VRDAIVRDAIARDAIVRRPLALFAVIGFAAAALAGCGGGSKDTGPPPDTQLDQANNAGTQALSMDLPAVAVRQYKLALKRAYERDDVAAIGDIGCNLALAQTRTGDPQAALDTVRETRGELDRRHAEVPAELILVQAAAAYRNGDSAGADGAAQEVLARAPTDPDTVRRAWYIRGIVAAERGDGATLGQAIAALPAAPAAVAKPSAVDGDRPELVGRAALLDGRPSDALVAFEQAADDRRQILDYRGMARALALAGDAALRANDTADAASFYLRAGRSMLLQGDKPAAQPLLRRAEDLARQSGQAGMVDEAARLRRTS
jgi:tetratricopeptide (TPR) repeat protein